MKTNSIPGIACVLAFVAAPVAAQSTIDATNKYAWSANTAWINLRPSAPALTQVTLQFATTRPSRLYRIQGSTSLLSTGPGAWADAGGLGTFTADPGSTSTKMITLPPGTARHFLRVVVVKPLQP